MAWCFVDRFCSQVRLCLLPTNLSSLANFIRFSQITLYCNTCGAIGHVLIFNIVLNTGYCKILFCSYRPYFTESKSFGDFRLSISIKRAAWNAQLPEMPNLFSWSTWTPYIWKQQNRQTLHYKLVTKGETSFNCANCKHPMRLKAHRQNGDGYIWRAFPIYVLYVNYFFNNIKNDRVHVQGSAHYAPKI